MRLFLQKSFKMLVRSKALIVLGHILAMYLAQEETHFVKTKTKRTKPNTTTTPKTQPQHYFRSFSVFKSRERI